MAKRQANTFLGLAPETIVEVIKVDTKTGKPQKKEMTVREWGVLKISPGYTYQAFQLGFSQFNLKTD